MIKEHPYYLAVKDYPTVEGRISMFMSTIREDEWFNEYDFLELCEDLIKSKREHFKAIRRSLTSRSIPGNPWYQVRLKSVSLPALETLRPSL